MDLRSIKLEQSTAVALMPMTRINAGPQEWI